MNRTKKLWKPFCQVAHRALPSTSRFKLSNYNYNFSTQIYFLDCTSSSRIQNPSLYCGLCYYFEILKFSGRSFCSESAEKASNTTCWNCNEAPKAAPFLFCESCRSVQPVDHSVDYFQIFGFSSTRSTGDSYKKATKWMTGFNDYVNNGDCAVVADELDSYLDEKVISRMEDFNILSWWKTNANRYPTLARIARDILAIPITTVASESAFNTSGRVVSSYHNKLHPSTLEALIEKKYEIGNEKLEGKYKDWQKRIHPDLVHSKSEKEREYAAEQSGRVIEAYRTLTNPLARAIYILRLEGVEVNEDETVSEPELLMEIMEIREAVEDAADSQTLKEIQSQMQEKLIHWGNSFADAYQNRNFDEARVCIRRMTYYHRVNEEIAKKL
ncbi:Iron-sulfur cluster co-chaperone protein HscB-like [Citrus sinensis]|nr:Iron-sulfur cluster co-chaperone protein HscB-like [Citrus sinensis]